MVPRLQDPDTRGMAHPRTHHRLRLFTAVVLSILFATAVPAAATCRSTSHTSPAGGVAGVPVPRLHWGSCGEGAPDGVQCATARVPLDYRRPQWNTIDLALARIPASDRAHRIGSLFVNPGGPGGSGVEIVSDPESFPAPLRARFDIVGVDPRGVGRSGQIECWSPEQYTQEYAKASGRAFGGPGVFAQTVAQAKQFNAACKAKARDLLPYLGSLYVARDLDLLRAAVGDRKLTFLAVSYGSYVANIYAALFPERVRALAIDGPLDTAAYNLHPADYARRRLVANDAALRRVLQLCKATPECAFGNGNPVGAWHRLLDRLDKHPVTIVGEEGFPVTTNASLLAWEVSVALFDGKEIWPPLLDALDELDRTNGGPLVDFFFADQYAFLSPNAQIDCADTAAVYTHELGQLKQSLMNDAASAPLMGSALVYGPPALYPHTPVCTVWTSPSVSRYDGSLAVRNIPPALVIGATGDPATDYAGSVTFARQIGGRLLTFEGEGHVVFDSSQCVGKAMAAYLINGKLPPRGAVCDDDSF